MNIVYLACQRAAVEEEFSGVPAKDRLEYEDYKSYIPREQPDINIPWSDAFPGLSAWLTDRAIKRLEQEKMDINPHDNQGWGSLY